jgi:Flp pilus assembly protein TadG
MDMTRPRLFSFALRSRRHPRGMALVEAAIVFPLVLMVTFAMIEYGWMFIKQEQLYNVARQAARLGATPDATNAQVTSLISSSMSSYGMGSSGYTYSPSPMNSQSTATGSPVTVTITVTYAKVQVTGVKLFPTPTTIHATMSMQKEGP